MMWNMATTAASLNTESINDKLGCVHVCACLLGNWNRSQHAWRPGKRAAMHMLVLQHGLSNAIIILA